MNSKKHIVRSQKLNPPLPPFTKGGIIKSLIITIFMLFTVYCLLSTNVHALDVKRTILPNGLIVLHSENHNLPIVMVTLIVKAGQLNEPQDKAGLANLAAGLLTEGTKNRKSVEISDEIEFIGASLDASAGSDYTTITLSVLKKDINKGFDLFSDILLNPIFPLEEIDRKRELTKGFLRQREEDPSFLAGRAFNKEVFGGHPYGRVIEGSVEIIDKIKREDLIKFHSDYFLPNNSILSIVGDLTSEELETLIKKYLSEWKKAEFPLRVGEKLSNEKKKKVIKIDKDLTQANIIIGNLGISRDNPDFYAVSVMNYILGGGGFASRLMQSIRDEMGLAYDVHSFFSAYKEEGSFQVSIQTKNESANTVVDEILKQIERIKKERVSDQELSDAKSYLTGSFPRRLDTNRKIADFLVNVEFYNLGLDYVEKYPDYINSVTKEDVLRVAQKYLNSENYVLVVVANQKKAALKD
ncbi:MAG: pitrilysin family protein [Nitrospirota bacterium]